MLSICRLNFISVGRNKSFDPHTRNLSTRPLTSFSLQKIGGGVCYAEFGVRVPHTSGSAYMYSYVTVGEFIAFVIGWNMVLEYLIGTSACACAISSCFDTLTSGNLKTNVEATFGSVFGEAPDVLAFGITLLMTILLVAGVKKSLLFNNLLNTFNLSVWKNRQRPEDSPLNPTPAAESDEDSDNEMDTHTPMDTITPEMAQPYYDLFHDDTENEDFDGFESDKDRVFIMVTGCFYINTSNWTDHGGFMPYGWSGVLTGAATCFYAFIGFDIIATTGEEANSPQKSIPLAIILSLIIILTAYVSSSMMLTLIIPYNVINSESALVEMFAQRGAVEAKYIVSVGALSGLTVSMFGSMFPMPRVVYAMAKDGLIFRSFSRVWPTTGTPALATVSLGIAAAFVALFVNLEVLVEMMSIGTLLAYTLVSTCVLILRYQPEKLSLVELLPKSIRSACSSRCQSPTKEKPKEQHVESRKVSNQRFISPDSDESEATPNEENENEGEFFDDNKYLVPDKCDYNKVYGAISGPKSQINREPGLLERHLPPAMYHYLSSWTASDRATDESGMFVIKVVAVMYLLIITMDLIIVCAMIQLVDGDPAAIFFFAACFIGIIICLLIITTQPQNSRDCQWGIPADSTPGGESRHAIMRTLKFMAPCLPVIPTIAVTINIYLIMKLSILTLIRFTVWMTIGLFLYFFYGIKNSSLELENNNTDSSIELKIPEFKQHNDVSAVNMESTEQCQTASANNVYKTDTENDGTLNAPVADQHTFSGEFGRPSTWTTFNE
ncbi:Cationic amino acid transporter 2 [Nymphon striatum]|nr:Cationic amino acid transporter 2 [Nymphon striatum]